MSWLSSGLSNLTGQLSNFTKEVLTEGTEEIDDHVTQLKVARSRNSELEIVCTTQRAELDKSTIDELSIQLQSKEMQMQNSITEYRSAIGLKEAEVKVLKLRQSEMSEHMSSSHMLPVELVTVQKSSSGFDDEREDFTDVISSQHEINSLRLEIRRLETEVKHWRHLASPQLVNETLEEENISVYDQLQTRNKELENELAGIVDRHQNELTALQDAHRKTLTSLKQGHSSALEQLQKQLEEHKQTSSAATRDIAAESSHINDKLKHLEEINRKLECDLAQTHAADRKKAAVIEELTLKLENSRNEIDLLSKNLEASTSKCDEMLREIQILSDERQDLGRELNMANQLIRSKDHELQQMKHKTDLQDESICKTGFQTSTPIAAGKFRARTSDDIEASIVNDLTSYEELSEHNQMLDQQVHALQTQIESYEQELEQFELVKSDWQMEKQSLEDVLIKLRADLQKKEELLSIVQARKDLNSMGKEGKCAEGISARKRKTRLGREGLIEAEHGSGSAKRKLIVEGVYEDDDDEALSDDSDDNIEVHAQKLDQKVSLLMKGNVQLEEERDQLVLDKDKLMSELEQQCHLVKSLEEQLNDSKEAVKNAESRYFSLKEECDQIASELSMVHDNSVTVRCDDDQSNSRGDADPCAGCTSLKEKLEEYSRKMELMSKELVEKDRLHLLDMKVKSDQVGELMLEKQSLTIEKKQLIDSLDELDAQQSQTMEQMVKSRNEALKSCEALKLQVEDLEEQLVVNEAKLAAVEEEESDKMAALESKSEELNDKWVTLELALKESESQKGRLEEQTMSQMDEIKRLAYQVMCLEDEKNKTAEKLKSLSSSVGSDLNTCFDSVELELLQKRGDELQTVRLEAGCQAHQLLELTAENDELNGSKQNLHREIENLTEALNLKDEKLNALQIELMNARSELKNSIERILLLTNEHDKLVESVRVMEQAMKSKETEMLSFKENYERLKSVAEQTEADGDRLSKHCKELTETNVNLEEKLKSLKVSVVETQEFARNGDLENEQNNFNGRELCDKVTESSGNSIPLASSSNSSLDIEINRLKSTVVQQEDLIRTLNGKYSSMLRLLEDRSLEIHGNTTLVDIHHMETEVHSLRKEREHMIAILDEKTREASSLKSEVHRLMNVVSAGKAAIAKLQQDSQEMLRNNGESLNEDMKKEAIRKLSQMIKDKDFEIEALSQKNSTLLQVLQSSSPEATGTQVSQLIQERDNLRKQLSIFQSDREQLINALNTKHQESVAYYEDCLRLKTAVTEMTEQRETLERNCSNLSQQYDDKHKSLMKALNELSNYRQKLSEMEKQYQKFGNNKNDKADTDKSSSPGIFYIGDSAATTLNATENVPQSEKEQIVTEKNQLVQDFEQRLAERDSILIARDQEISKLSQLVSQLEAASSAKESDLAMLRKMCDNLTFKVQSASIDHSELSHEIENLRSRCEALSSELLSLKQVNSSLMVGSNQKDFELNALKERLNSLNQAANQAESSTVENDQHKVDLVRHIEALTRQSQGLQQERDQVYIALQYQQAESSELKNELTRLSEKEQRLMKECERLRGHLLHIEEGYTREAIEAEEREKQLRNQLASAEEKISSSSAAIHSARSDSNKHVENLQIQLHALAEQRDNALLQLSSAQETISSYASSLSNLQMVLEQFQSERQHQQSIEIEKYQRSLQQKQAECQQLQSQIHQLQIQLEEKTDALKAAQRLSEQIDRKQEMISALREEVLLREAELTRAENEIHKLTSHTEARVDKLLMKSLLTGYFHAPASKRAEALQVIGHILDFSKEELKEVGVMTSASEGSWIGGLFRKKSASISVPRSQTTKNTDQSTSFSELFVSFLEKESLPPAFARLPTERMVEEQQQKKAAPFNPFSVPMHSNSPPTLLPEASSIMASGSKSSLLMDSSNNSSPFFMRPISPHNFPVFAPVLNRDEAAADVPRFAVGRDSNSSSQRSTPTGSMLRDVLQQK